MTLGLTEEHRDLAAAIRGWAQRNCPADVLRAAADGQDSGSGRYRESLGPGLAEQGVLGLHLPECHGGQGYGLPELAVAIEELGRALVPGGCLPTVFASAALAAAGPAAAGPAGKLLAGLADGSAAGAVSLAPGLTGRAGPDGSLIIDGEAGPVLGGSLADVVIAGVQTDQGEVWAAIDAASLDISGLDSLDLTRPVALVRADGVAGEPPAGRQRELAAGVAAVVALDAAVSCAHECIQVLGGIGYTWEHDAHLYYRRAMSLRALLGPSDEWARRVAELTMSGARRPVNVELPDSDASLRAAVRDELAEIAALTGRERTERLAAGGWVAPHLPRPWGRAASPVEQLVIDQEMRAAGVRAPALAIGAWVAPALIQYGTPGQQERFLPPTLRGEFLWCQLFSEPGAGSDLAGLTTRAERAEGGWRLTGQKIWTSLAKQAAWAICIARTDPAAPRHDGITYFLVDMSAPGVEVRPLRELTGDSLFNQVFLDDVFVPDDCVVGEVNGGWRIARTTLANERVSLSRSWTFGSGVAELLEVANAAAAAGQVPLGQVGALACEGHAIDLLAVRVTLKQLSGTEPGATGSVRKLLGMRHAQRVSELCWSISGAAGALGGGAGPAVGPSGTRGGSHWARQVLLTRALTIGGGTTDIQLNIIGERILGLPRDPEPPGA